MSRWLWALLGGVVLVAITAVFWIDQRTNVLPPVLPSTTAVAPTPAPASTAQKSAPSAPSSPSPPAPQDAGPASVHTCGAGRAAGRNLARPRAAACPWRAPGSAGRAGCSRSAPCRS